MWKLTLKLEKESSYVTETLEFQFEKYGELAWFMGEALDHSKGNVKSIVEYVKEEKKDGEE